MKFCESPIGFFPLGFSFKLRLTLKNLFLLGLENDPFLPLGDENNQLPTSCVVPIDFSI